MNECKPRFLGVAVMHWARPMAAELRDTRSERRKGSSSDISSVREKARIALLRKGFSWAFKQQIWAMYGFFFSERVFVRQNTTPEN